MNLRYVVSNRTKVCRICGKSVAPMMPVIALVHPVTKRVINAFHRSCFSRELEALAVELREATDEP